MNQQQEYNKQLEVEKSKLEGQRIKDHAQATQDIYEEIHRVLQQKYAQDEKLKMAKIKHELALEYKRELNEKESYYQALLQKE